MNRRNPLLRAGALLALALGAAACSVGSELEAQRINDDAGITEDLGLLDPKAPDPDPEAPPEGEEGEGDDGIDADAEVVGKDGGPVVDDDVPDDASDPPDDTPELPVPPDPDDDGSVEPDDASVEPFDAGPPDPAMDGGARPPPVTATPPRYTVVFSRRDASDANDTAVEDAMVGVIRHAAPGSRLRVAMYSFTRYRPAAELINAYRRGVDVRLVLDGHVRSMAGTEAPRLIAALGRDRVTLCGPPGTSCEGTGIMHDKFITASALDDGSRNVVVVASHNLTGSQLHLHNNAVVVRNDVGLFRAYERTFDDMSRDVTATNYYRIEDGEQRTRAYFFPRTDGGDTVASVLENVRCDRTSRVRVAMAFFTNRRLEVAQALASLRRDGCSVWVVVGDGSIPPGRAVLSTLRSAGVRVTLYPPRTRGWGLHSKYLLIDAPYAGSAGHQHLVFTGSHNWTGGALTDNDENMLRVEDGAVFNAFLSDWVRVREAAGRR